MYAIRSYYEEDIVPTNVNRAVHTLAPIISITVALVTFAVVPFGDTITLFGHEVKLMIADINVGVLYILRITSYNVCYTKLLRITFLIAALKKVSDDLGI